MQLYFNLSIWGVLALNCRLILPHQPDTCTNICLRLDRHVNGDDLRALPLRCRRQRIAWDFAEAELAQTWFFSKPWHAASQHIYRCRQHSKNTQTNTSLGFSTWPTLLEFVFPLKGTGGLYLAGNVIHSVNLCSLYRQQPCLVVLK